MGERRTSKEERERLAGLARWYNVSEAEFGDVAALIDDLTDAEAELAAANKRIEALRKAARRTLDSARWDTPAQRRQPAFDDMNALSEALRDLDALKPGDTEEP